MTMEAISFDLASKDLKYHSDYPIPKLENDKEIMVKVEFSGVCGTDVHIIQGAFPCNNKRRFVMGHEFSGTVVEVGKASSFKKGERVVVNPNSGCNLCHFCQSGQYHMCQIGGINNAIGIWRDGGWAQYAVIPETQATVMSDGITFEQGALCEPYSCLARGWDRAQPITVGQKILVIGAGIIGNLWITALHLQGHRNVTVSEINQTRLNQVKKLETGYRLITPTTLSSESHLYDVIIDCSGVAKAMEAAFNFLNYGGKYVVFGCCGTDDFIKINPYEIYKKESSIIGVNVNPFTMPKAIGLLEAMGDRYLAYEKLGVKVFALKQYKEALEELKSGGISKAMFKLN